MDAIYAYIGVVLGVNVGIYGSPMECLGMSQHFMQSTVTQTSVSVPFFGQAKRRALQRQKRRVRTSVFGGVPERGWGEWREFEKMTVTLLWDFISWST